MANIKGKNKSVLIVSNCTWYLYNFRKELLNDLKEKGHKLILLSPYDKYYSRISKYFDQKEKLFLLRGSENPFFEIITIINLFLAYKKFKPDLVHHFTIKPCIYGGVISRFLGIKNTINHVTGIGPSFYSSRIKIEYLNKILKPFYKYAFNNKKNNIINIFHNSSDRDTFLKNRITKEITDFDKKKLKIKKKRSREIEVISGPYKSVNLLKNDYIKLKHIGFEEMDIFINE